MLIYSSLEAEHTSISPIAVSDSTKATTPEILTVDSGSNNNKNNANDDDADIDITKSTISIFSANPAVLALAREQILALLSYVKTHLLPSYLSHLAKSAQATSTEVGTTPVPIPSVAPNSTNPTANNIVPLIPAPDPQAFLIGSLHTGLFSLLQRSGSYTLSNPIPNIRVHRFDDPPYYKYFFRRSEFSPDADSGKSANLPFVDPPLPSGYRFHDREGRVGVLSKHLDLVQSRTHIPRPRKQLSMMPGMAIYFDSGSSDADEMPIAWGFLGVDGALATLHVEPEHRGRGLAVPLSKAIMRRGMSVDGVFGAGVNSEDSQTRERVGAWAHAEVAGYNKASRRVMEKIGGQVLTTVTWTVIELCG
ncbi:Acyl-CoA N-acyltransferase [Penicillium griseofulvum]|uniref:Acyl-CoA N-acyltransferase n=1 Tax=Penicillium patulum TaxID=5078 RepID=A0A135LAA4_PENPA|nr:Acyl-CoA N-acyltransferase [Penicillium griseofulvum]KXG45883.1 Acyl-CoA N-acyltransferase [Penicillium griseofulvum]